MNHRAVACFERALTDVGLGEDQPVRAVLRDYFTWATFETMNRYERSPDDVPEGLRITRWSWNGLVEGG
jgi:hemoglobin